VFTVLLTVILGVCIGAVAADLLFGPEQPATPDASSNGERWDPWRRWLGNVRHAICRVAGRAGHVIVAGARALKTAAARLLDLSLVQPARAAHQARADLRSHRQARRQRKAAHARHMAHQATLPAAYSSLPDEDEEEDDDEAWSGEPAWPEAAVPVSSWQGNGSPAPATPSNGSAGTVPAPSWTTPEEEQVTVPAGSDDPTEELTVPITAEAPVMSSPPPASVATPRTRPAPVETRRVAEPRGQLPPDMPETSRLRALAILSVLVCLFGVATASVLLVVIVTLSRAVGGV
jgi:hypothetical protein